MVEVLVLVDSGVVVVRETWTAIVRIRGTSFHRDGDVLDPATPLPLS